MSRIEIHLSIEDGDASAVDRLADVSDLSKQRIKQAMQKGAVWLQHGKKTKRVRRATKSVRRGDQLHLYYDEQILSTQPPPAYLIADEGDYSIWYKPYGMLSQGSKWGDHATINRWAEQHLTPQRPAFVVHRLDRAATGLILIAHKKRVAADLSRLFRERKVEKCYRVIVHGKFPETPRPYTVTTEIEKREACSHFSLMKYDSERDRSLLDVVIESGRKHQIRRHLAGVGYPIVGDRLYGRDKDTEDLKLTAYLLAFCCPITSQKREYRLKDDYMPVL